MAIVAVGVGGVIQKWSTPTIGTHYYLSPEQAFGERDHAGYGVEPLVVEVSADTAMTGISFRHAVLCLRTRPELRPDELPTASAKP